MMWCFEIGHLLLIVIWVFMGGMVMGYWISHNWVHLRAQRIALVLGWLAAGGLLMAWMKGWLR